MSNSTLVVQAIRAALRARGMTYRELAKALGVSEPTIKRNLGRGDFSLSRLDRICEVLEISLPNLLDSAAASSYLTELSEAQEQALVRDPKLLLLTYLLVNEWRIADIIETFDLDENAIVGALLELDRLKIVDYRPPTAFAGSPLAISVGVGMGRCTRSSWIGLRANSCSARLVSPMHFGLSAAP